MNADSPRISVYLLDDHDIVLKGIRSLLEMESDFEVVGCATQAVQALRELAELRPQVLVLDLSLPDMSGGEVMRQLQTWSPPVPRIVVFTMHSDIGYVSRVLKEGALGYVVKDKNSSHLIAAIRAAARGESYLCPPFTIRQVRAYRRQLRQSDRTPKKHPLLTYREQDVLYYVAHGYTSREIAQVLRISVRTVEKHRYNIMKKLDLKNQAEVVQMAIQWGLVSQKDR